MPSKHPNGNQRRNPRRKQTRRRVSVPSVLRLRQGQRGDARVGSGRDERASLKLSQIQPPLWPGSTSEGLLPRNGGFSLGTDVWPGWLVSPQAHVGFWSEVAESITRTGNCTFCKLDLKLPRKIKDACGHMTLKSPSHHP